MVWQRLPNGNGLRKRIRVTAAHGPTRGRRHDLDFGQRCSRPQPALPAARNGTGFESLSVISERIGASHSSLPNDDQAIVLLGCRPSPRALNAAPLRKENINDFRAFDRRIWRAAAAYHSRIAHRIVASGGCRWTGTSEKSEAELLADGLESLGVPRRQVLLESRSRSTAENALYSSAILAPMPIRRLWVVTCDFHMARARHAFSRLGYESLGLPALSPTLTPSRHLQRSSVELSLRTLGYLFRHRSRPLEGDP